MKTCYTLTGNYQPRFREPIDHHMKPYISYIRILTIAALTLCTPFIRAELLSQGSTFPEFKGNDQFDTPCEVEADTRWVLISFDMSTGKKANQYFENAGKDFLPSHHAVFVANIYGMPWIGRKFALPKMRKYPHRILLADAEGLLDPFPQEASRVTVFKLNPDRTIAEIRFWDPGEETLEL